MTNDDHIREAYNAVCVKERLHPTQDFRSFALGYSAGVTAGRLGKCVKRLLLARAWLCKEAGRPMHVRMSKEVFDFSDKVRGDVWEALTGERDLGAALKALGYDDADLDAFMEKRLGKPLAAPDEAARQEKIWKASMTNVSAPVPSQVKRKKLNEGFFSK